jgi:hypothetical protein
MDRLAGRMRSLDLLRSARHSGGSRHAEPRIEERHDDVGAVDKLFVDDALSGTAEAGYRVRLPFLGQEDDLFPLSAR